MQLQQQQVAGCLRDVQGLVKAIKSRTEGFDASVSMLLGSDDSVGM